MKTSAAYFTLFLGSTSALSASYMETLGGGSSSVSGGGLTGYLDALPSGAAAPTSGGGLTGYLDSFTGSAPAPVVPDAPPAPVAAAAAAPAQSVSEAAAPAPIDTSLSGGGVPTYTELLAVGAQTSGSGVPSHVDLLAVGAQTSGGGVASYTSLLATNPATTAGPGIASYTEALGVKSTSSAPPAPSTPTVGGSTSFLGGIYNMILDLDPEEVKGAGGRLDKEGSDLTFAVGDSTPTESIAMSFIRRG